MGSNNSKSILQKMNVLQWQWSQRFHSRNTTIWNFGNKREEKLRIFQHRKDHDFEIMSKEKVKNEQNCYKKQKQKQKFNLFNSSVKWEYCQWLFFSHCHVVFSWKGENDRQGKQVKPYHKQQNDWRMLQRKMLLSLRRSVWVNEQKIITWERNRLRQSGRRR